MFSLDPKVARYQARLSMLRLRACPAVRGGDVHPTVWKRLCAITQRDPGRG